MLKVSIKVGNPCIENIMTNASDKRLKSVTRTPLSQVFYLFVMLVYGEVVNEWAKHRGVRRAILHTAFAFPCLRRQSVEILGLQGSLLPIEIQHPLENQP